jgi:hypothetical protein
MPWKECNYMDERLRLVARLLDGEKLCMGSTDVPGIRSGRSEMRPLRRPHEDACSYRFTGSNPENSPLPRPSHEASARCSGHA